MLIAFEFLLETEMPGGYLHVQEIPRAGDFFGDKPWHIDHVVWYPGEDYIWRAVGCGTLPRYTKRSPPPGERAYTDGPIVAVLHLSA